MAAILKSCTDRPGLRFGEVPFLFHFISLERKIRYFEGQIEEPKPHIKLAESIANCV